MYSSRGSSLLEVVVALSIVSIMGVATLRISPLQSASKLRATISRAILKAAIQSELDFISARCVRRVSPALVFTEKASVLGRFSAVTRPAANAVALISVDANWSPFDVQHVVREDFNEQSITSRRYPQSKPIAALGCSPISCLELRCAAGTCRTASRSVLRNTADDDFQFTAMIVPVQEIVAIYLSARGTLRRASIVGGVIIDNQPLHDEILSFEPSIVFPPELRGGCLVSATVATTKNNRERIEVHSLQHFVSPPIPLALLQMANR